MSVDKNAHEADRWRRTAEAYGASDAVRAIAAARTILSAAHALMPSGQEGAR